MGTQSFFAMAVGLSCSLITLLGGATLSHATERTFGDRQRVLVVGDSISQDGRWVEYLDAYLATRHPDRSIEIINIGLSSETVSGLSEPGHPFPRPHLHDRLEHALEQTQPDLVFVFYGMNDAIYMPFDRERFIAYQEGMRQAIERIEAVRARPILMTPPPFDPLPIKDNTRSLEQFDPSEAGGPYVNYDYVLATYGQWLLTLADETYQVVDVGRTMREHVLDRHFLDPDYTVVPDGIHPDAFGHWMITQAVLTALDAPAEVGVAEVDVAERTTSADVHYLETHGGGEVSFTWVSRVPMPLDADWPDDLVTYEQVNERFNRHRLRVTNVPDGEYDLYEGDTRLGTVTATLLESGVDMLAFDELRTNRRARELGPLIRDRQQLLAPAWREHIGHGHPNKAETEPLRQVQQTTDAISRQIDDLSQPVTLQMRLVPRD